ncbi:MAG: hypothetical protein IT379_03290 [Deltaproteobacteria bacterium]|nr:hypothetical protein [Deltaproteobacteria bacterium]
MGAATFFGYGDIGPHHRLAWHGSGWTLAAIGETGELQITTFDGDGAITGTQTGALSARDSADAVVAWTGSEWGVVWSTTEAGVRRIYLARFDHEGTPLAAPLDVNAIAPRTTTPVRSRALAFDETRGYVLATNDRTDDVFTITLQVLGFDGTAPDAPVTLPFRWDDIGLAADGAGTFAVFGVSSSLPPFGVTLLRVDGAGTMTSDPVMRDHDYDHPRMFHDGTGWLASWTHLVRGVSVLHELARGEMLDEITELDSEDAYEPFESGPTTSADGSTFIVPVRRATRSGERLGTWTRFDTSPPLGEPVRVRERAAEIVAGGLVAGTPLVAAGPAGRALYVWVTPGAMMHARVVTFDDCTCPAEAPVQCDTSCVDARSDARNCGECGMTCPTTASCIEGRCACRDPGLVACGDRCVSTTSDPSSCGGCDNACPDGGACLDGACACSAPTVGPITMMGGSRPRLAPSSGATVGVVRVGPGLVFDRLDESGTLVGDPVTLTSRPVPRSQSFSIAWSGTEWGVAWAEETASSADVIARFQRFGPDGSAVGSATTVSTDWYTASFGGSQVRVAWADGWVVAANAPALIASAPLFLAGTVLVQRLDADGNPAGPPVDVGIAERGGFEMAGAPDGRVALLLATEVGTNPFDRRLAVVDRDGQVTTPWLVGYGEELLVASLAFDGSTWIVAGFDVLAGSVVVRRGDALEHLTVLDMRADRLDPPIAEGFSLAVRDRVVSLVASMTPRRGAEASTLFHALLVSPNGPNGAAALAQAFTPIVDDGTVGSDPWDLSLSTQYPSSAWTGPGALVVSWTGILGAGSGAVGLTVCR